MLLLAAAAGVRAGARPLLDAARKDDARRGAEAHRRAARMCARRPPTAPRRCTGPRINGELELVKRLLKARRGCQRRATTTVARRCRKPPIRGDAAMLTRAAQGRRGRRIRQRRRRDRADDRGAHRQGRRGQGAASRPAPTSMRASHWRGQTALMWAAAQRQPEMVRLLLQSGADAERASRHCATGRARPRPSRGRSGVRRARFTALQLAAREGCADCARELVKGGANINLAESRRHHRAAVWRCSTRASIPRRC